MYCLVLLKNHYWVFNAILYNVLLLNNCHDINADAIGATDCKFTQVGTEYSGKIAVTTGGTECQNWLPENPVHKVDPKIVSRLFPERSMTDAKNYCRNPTRDKRGPWCYTLEPTLIDDECDIPLCKFEECRVTGTGAEYSGKTKISSSGRKCKSWNNRYKLNNKLKTDKFSGKRFPEQAKSNAANYCRNPDDNEGGPWCYVEEENFETVERDYCDVPFCYDRDCLSYARNDSTYSITTKINADISNFTLWLKLWNPSNYLEGEVRVLFSDLPIPTTGENIAKNWKAGLEIIISNTGTGITYPSKNEEIELEETPNILSGLNWTGVWFNWAGGFISVGIIDSVKSILVHEFKEKNTILSFFPDNFLYYAIKGTGVLWSTNFCQNYCEVHNVFGLDFINSWPIQKNNGTYEISFYVRGSRNIAIRLYRAPSIFYPCFTIFIGGDGGSITVIHQESEKSTKQFLKTQYIEGLLNFWIWNEFFISIFGPHMRIYVKKSYGNEEIMYVYSKLFESLRWFSIGSENTTTMWTLFCSPDKDVVEDPWIPNCINNPTDRYEGNQWTSINEIPCVPWISTQIPENERLDNRFVDDSVVKALNKCRNPTNDPKGPYCFVIPDYSKQFCPIRACKSSECRMAGTANDYIGTLSTTRSGRKCTPWFNEYDYTKILMTNETKINVVTKTDKHVSTNQNKSNETTNQKVKVTNEFLTELETDKMLNRSKRILAGQLKAEEDAKKQRLKDLQKLLKTLRKPVHSINSLYFNDSLYPEQSMQNASNYCRNPSRNIAGTWCYTTDSHIPIDLCNVRDCELPEECTFFVRGDGSEIRSYILPEYRSEGLHFSIKSWEPDNPDSITFEFKADDNLKSRYVLKIGAENNEKILLYYQSESEDLKLVSEKILPHLIYMGKWSSFVVRIPRGKIELYYQGAPNPLFEWHNPEQEKPFLPIYYCYSSELNNTIGIAFDCNSRCHIENTKTRRFTRIFPISAWHLKETPNPDKLQIMIRAKGVVLVPLLLLPATAEYYGFTLGEDTSWIYFLKNQHPEINILFKQKIEGPIFNTHSWTNVTIKWHDNTILVFRNESVVFSYEHTDPLLFYYFSVAVDPGGWATWATNCIPTEIDGEARDGGWSEWGPWACSVSCNGGIGTRKRLCNSPEPNVRGESCLGPSVMNGRCNTIICGDITEDTIKAIKRRIKGSYTALKVVEGKRTTIFSDPDIIDAITKESPDAEIKWSHNGIFIHTEPGRKTLKKFDIIIKKSTLNDSGVYTMTLHRVDKTYMTIKIVSLVVLPNEPSIVIRQTLPLQLICHCSVLGYVYSDLNVQWIIKNKIWKNYGTTLPIVVNSDFIPKINNTHNGLWKCVVKQNDLGYEWITNAMLIKVIGPPNWRTHLMEDKLTKPLFGWMPNETFVAVSVVILFLVLALCAVTVSFKISKIDLKSKYKKLKTVNSRGKDDYDNKQLVDQDNHNSLKEDSTKSKTSLLNPLTKFSNKSKTTIAQSKYGNIIDKFSLKKRERTDLKSNSKRKTLFNKPKWKNRRFGKFGRSPKKIDDEDKLISESV